MGDERPVKLNDQQETEVHDADGEVVARITVYKRKGKLMARVRPPRGGRVIPQKREQAKPAEVRKRLTKRQPDA